MTAPLDGVVIVDKPSGPTSHDVVSRVRQASGTRRVGHAGTLDPLATGVLPLVLGTATRLVRFLPADPKVYETGIRLGIETATGDADGEPLAPPRPTAHIADADIERALTSLRGEIDQVPPMFSAKRVAGKRLYRAARRGEVVERAAVRVTVHEIRVLARHGDRLDLLVRCSPGTYVRALVTDLGRALGTGATVETLRRIQSGGFAVAAAHPLARLTDRDAVSQALLPIDDLPLALPSVDIGAAETARFVEGRTIDVAGVPGEGAASLVAVRGAGRRLLGIAELKRRTPDAHLELHPRVVRG